MCMVCRSVRRWWRVRNICFLVGWHGRLNLGWCNGLIQWITHFFSSSQRKVHLWWMVRGLAFLILQMMLQHLIEQIGQKREDLWWRIGCKSQKEQLKGVESCVFRLVSVEQVALVHCVSTVLSHWPTELFRKYFIQSLPWMISHCELVSYWAQDVMRYPIGRTVMDSFGTRFQITQFSHIFGHICIVGSWLHEYSIECVIEILVDGKDVVFKELGKDHVGNGIQVKVLWLCVWKQLRNHHM